jgi:hypothetical protein
MDRSKGRKRTAQGQADLCGDGGCKQQGMQSAGGGYDVARDDLGMHRRLAAQLRRPVRSPATGRRLGQIQFPQRGLTSYVEMIVKHAWLCCLGCCRAFLSQERGFWGVTSAVRELIAAR